MLEDTQMRDLVSFIYTHGFPREILDTRFFNKRERESYYSLCNTMGVRSVDSIRETLLGTLEARL